MKRRAKNIATWAPVGVMTIRVAARDALDEAMQTEAPEIVGHRLPTDRAFTAPEYPTISSARGIAPDPTM